MAEDAGSPRGRATAEMVAERASVSRVAVSRAFNPHTSLKPEKRELILRIAQELNYTPDRAARALVSASISWLSQWLHTSGTMTPTRCERPLTRARAARSGV